MIAIHPGHDHHGAPISAYVLPGHGHAVGDVVTLADITDGFQFTASVAAIDNDMAIVIPLEAGGACNWVRPTPIPGRDGLDATRWVFDGPHEPTATDRLAGLPVVAPADDADAEIEIDLRDQ